MKLENREQIEVLISLTGDLTLSEIKELDSQLDSNDVSVDVNGEEYRIIEESVIDDIWEESLKELLEDCYEIPPLLKNYIDYDKWVEDCKFDGLGHHFSTYDGSEESSGSYYYFRTN